jgi:hypothetical protein
MDKKNSNALKFDHVTLSRKDIIINNLLGGIFWALGGTIGLAIIFIVLGVFTAWIDPVPIIGDFVARINEFVLQKTR